MEPFDSFSKMLYNFLVLKHLKTEPPINQFFFYFSI